MTEIPEHLLKRSRERRAALTGESPAEAAPGESAGTGAATPAVQQAASAPATPAGPTGRAAPEQPPAPPPPKPVRPEVVAARNRRKIPFWAMAALSLMPIWVFMYARALTHHEEAAAGPLGIGEEVYTGCASCHGGDGGGGVGYAFSGGEVLSTFPHIEDQLRFVYFGTAGYNLAGVEIYGNPEREGGPHITGERGAMPQQGSTAGGDLTDAEILSVVCHERYTLGGADPSGEFATEFEEWCSEESEIFAALEGGTLSLSALETTFDVIPIGTEPAPGSPPGAE